MHRTTPQFWKYFKGLPDLPPVSLGNRRVNPSENDTKYLIIAAHQQITRDWWDIALPKCEAFISAIVLEEAAKGDSEAARLRLEQLASFLDYLVSWNCTHIVSGRVRMLVEEINATFGIRTPIICTPEELMEV